MTSIDNEIDIYNGLSKKGLSYLDSFVQDPHKKEKNKEKIKMYINNHIIVSNNDKQIIFDYIKSGNYLLWDIIIEDLDNSTILIYLSKIFEKPLKMSFDKKCHLIRNILNIKICISDINTSFSNLLIL